MTSRYSISLFLLLALLSLSGLWTLVDSEYQERITALITERQITTSITAERISGFLSEPAYLLKNLIKDISILKDPDLSNDMSSIDATLLSLSTRYPSFNQVRWVDETGLERIRLQRNNGLITHIPNSNLQNKSDRYYFKEAMKLSDGEIYYSPIDLNVEYGAIETPYRPTIRIATPIFLPNGDKKGIFIINRDAQEVLNIIERLPDQKGLSLVNENGYWLKGQIPEEDWGFMFNKEFRVATLSPIAWDKMKLLHRGNAVLGDGVWVWSTILPLDSFRVYKPALQGKSQTYKIIYHVPQSDLDAIAWDIRLKYFGIFVLALLIISFLIFRLRQAGVINQQVLLKLHQTESLRKAESRALSAEIESRLLIESSINGIMTIDESGLIVMANPAIEDIFGYQETDLMEQPVRKLIPEIVNILPAIINAMDITLNSKLLEGVTSDGSIIPLEVNFSPFVGTQNIKVAITVVDISERLEIEKNNRLTAEVFENTVEGIVITDPESNIVKVNQAFTDIFGYTASEVIGKNTRILQSGSQDDAFYQAMWKKMQTDGHWKGEVWSRKKNGETYPELLTLSQIKNDQGDVLYYVGIFTDISDIKQSQEKLKHLAHHDPLTDLPNRLLITDRIQQTIKQGKRNGNQFAIMFIDLDFFKGINDTYGHTTGDKLLRQVSHRIQRLIRDEDTLARLGGDEFVLLQENVHQASDTMTMAKKIIKSFKSPFKIYEIELRISTSIGICLYPNDGKTAENLLKNADTAMYLAKDEGRNNFQFYTKSLTKKAKENLRMENEMRKALENGDFMVHYQPQVNMKTGQLTGFEALSRWHHGEWGAVSPVKFIPAAERCGLINALGESMLLMACRQGKEWLDRGYEFGRISVNISGAQLKNGNLVKAIKDTLVETGFPSRHLELEVTESCVMDQFESAIEQLKAIRKLGVTISIDDFGTGHSSLSYLKMMPVSKLKIDRSFIKDIPADQDDIAITQTIIAMSNALKLETIAEGIETQEQVDFLLSNGCMLAQGYYYSRPEEAEKIEKKYWTGKKAKLKVV